MPSDPETTTWTIQQKDGRTVICDGTGKRRHVSNSPELLATYYAGALQQLDQQQARLETLANALRDIRSQESCNTVNELADAALDCLKETMTAIRMDGGPDEQREISIA